MKKIMGLVFGVMFLLSAGLAYAIPTLQLDIEGGIYDFSTQTVIATSKDFSLFAYLIPDNKVDTSTPFFLSAAVVPQPSSSASLGSYSIAQLPNPAATVNVPADMLNGGPALLPTHGIFDTYYNTFPITFNGAPEISPYNTQDRAISGDPIVLSGTGMYYREFEVNVTGLAEGSHIHFDLYGYYTGASGKTQIEFAPFSHDAQSNGNGNGNGHSVPEPSTLLLLGSGLLGLIGFSRKFKK